MDYRQREPSTMAYKKWKLLSVLFEDLKLFATVFYNSPGDDSPDTTGNNPTFNGELQQYCGNKRLFSAFKHSHQQQSRSYDAEPRHSLQNSDICSFRATCRGNRQPDKTIVKTQGAYIQSNCS